MLSHKGLTSGICELQNNNKEDKPPMFILNRVNYTGSQLVHENVLNMKIKIIKDIISHSLEQLKLKYWCGCREQVDFSNMLVGIK